MMQRGLVLLAAMLALTTGACRTAPVYNAVNVPLVSPQPLTLELIRDRIGRAARIQGWEIEDIQPGILIATKRAQDHVATTTLTFDTASFSITLRSSIKLRQRGAEIHKLYNRWVEALELSIRQEVSSPY